MSLLRSSPYLFTAGDAPLPGTGLTLGASASLAVLEANGSLALAVYAPHITSDQVGLGDVGSRFTVTVEGSVQGGAPGEFQFIDKIGTQATAFSSAIEADYGTGYGDPTGQDSNTVEEFAPETTDFEAPAFDSQPGEFDPGSELAPETQPEESVVAEEAPFTEAPTYATYEFYDYETETTITVTYSVGEDGEPENVEIV